MKIFKELTTKQGNIYTGINSKRFYQALDTNEEDKKIWDIRLFSSIKVSRDISIIKFNKEYYNGQWEIFGYDKLFLDVERYDTFAEVEARLLELEGSE